MVQGLDGDSRLQAGQQHSDHMPGDAQPVRCIAALLGGIVFMMLQEGWVTKLLLSEIRNKCFILLPRRSEKRILFFLYFCVCYVSWWENVCLCPLSVCFPIPPPPPYCFRVKDSLFLLASSLLSSQHNRKHI